MFWNRKKQGPTPAQEQVFRALCVDVCAHYPFAQGITRTQFEIGFLAAALTFSKDVVPARYDLLTKLPVFGFDYSDKNAWFETLLTYGGAINWFWLDASVRDERPRKNVAACYAYGLSQ